MLSFSLPFIYQFDKYTYKKESKMKLNNNSLLDIELKKHKIRFYQLVNGYMAIGIIVGIVWMLAQVVKLFVWNLY